MNCLACLLDAGGASYHPQCLQALFGEHAVPSIDLDPAKLHVAGLSMVGRMSVPGVQRKVAVELRPTLHVEPTGGSFFLKPQSPEFPHLPENEHVTMRIAELFGIPIPPCALVRLNDGSLAYLVRRFDRLADGRKLRQEDFCQLAQQSPKEKYRGSAELCVKLVRRYASEPIIEMLEFYRRLVFIWWTANGDMHLKNFSLLAGEDGVQKLSPAYDLLCTRLVLPDDKLALPIGGKNDNLTPRIWREVAAYMGLPAPAAKRIHAAVGRSVEPAVALVRASFLPDDQKAVYEAILRERAASFAAEA